MEFVWLNGLCNRIKVRIAPSPTNPLAGIYPIVALELGLLQIPSLLETRFGIQRVLLYADPDNQITVTAARHNHYSDAPIRRHL